MHKFHFPSHYLTIGTTIVMPNDEISVEGKVEVVSLETSVYDYLLVGGQGGISHNCWYFTGFARSLLYFVRSEVLHLLSCTLCDLIELYLMLCFRGHVQDQNYLKQNLQLGALVLFLDCVVLHGLGSDDDYVYLEMILHGKYRAEVPFEVAATRTMFCNLDMLRYGFLAGSIS